jgi:hypothetical protein
MAENDEDIPTARSFAAVTSDYSKKAPEKERDRIGNTLAVSPEAQHQHYHADCWNRNSMLAFPSTSTRMGNANGGASFMTVLF